MPLQKLTADQQIDYCVMGSENNNLLLRRDINRLFPERRCGNAFREERNQILSETCKQKQMRWQRLRKGMLQAVS